MFIINPYTYGLNPSNIANLTTWYKADSLYHSDNTIITTFPDSSGNGRDFTQATSGLRPDFRTNIINGKPAIRFNGTNANSHMTMSSLPSMTSATWFIVYFGIGTGSFELLGTDNNHSYVYYTGDNNGYQGTFRTDRVNSHPLNMSQGRYGVHIIKGSSATEYQFWLDKMDKGSSLGSTFSAGTTNWILGGAKDGSAQVFNFFNGYIAEVIVYNSQLSVKEEDIINRYIENKYGIQNVPGALLGGASVSVDHQLNAPGTLSGAAFDVEGPLGNPGAFQINNGTIGSTVTWSTDVPSVISSNVSSPYFINDSNSYITTSSNISIGDNQSFSFWIKGVINNTKPFHSSSNDASHYIYLSTSNISIREGTTHLTFNTTSLSSTTTWYNIVIVRQSGNARVFVNGTESSSGSQAFSSNAITVDKIGYSASGYTLVGNVADIKKFDSVITSTDITNLAAGNEAVTNPSYVLKLNDGTGSVAVGTVGATWNKDVPTATSSNIYSVAFSAVNTDSKITLTANATLSTTSTFSFWFKRPVGNDDDIIFSRNDSLNPYIRIPDATTVVLSDDSGNTATFAIPTVGNNTWYNIIITRNGSSTTRLYFNGVESGSGALTLSGTLTFNQLGLYYDGSNSTLRLQGKVADVRKFDSVLSSGDIAAINAGTPTTATPSLWLKMNEGKGRAIKDRDYNPYSVKFRGTSFTDKITLPHQICINKNDGAFSCWFKVNTFGSSSHFILASSVAGDYILQYEAGVFYMTYRTGSSTSGASTVNTGQWYHIVVNRIFGKTYFYLNGSAITMTQGQANDYNNYIDTFGLYGANNSSGHQFDGKMTDVRVFASALSTSDISSLSTGGNGSKTPTYHWKMNDGIGSTVNTQNTSSIYSVATGAGGSTNIKTSRRVSIGQNGAFSCWVKRTNVNDSFGVIASGGLSGLEFPNGTQMNVYLDNGTQYSFTCALPITMVDGIWYNLILNRKAGITQVYLNGLQETTYGGVSQQGYFLHLDYLGYNLIGKISDVRVYADALSETDIGTIAAGGEAQLTPIHMWTLNQNDGVVAKDTGLYDYDADKYIKAILSGGDTIDVSQEYAVHEMVIAKKTAGTW